MFSTMFRLAPMKPLFQPIIWYLSTFHSMLATYSCQPSAFPLYPVRFLCASMASSSISLRSVSNSPGFPGRQSRPSTIVLSNASFLLGFRMFLHNFTLLGVDDLVPVPTPLGGLPQGILFRREVPLEILPATLWIVLIAAEKQESLHRVLSLPSCAKRHSPPE